MFMWELPDILKIRNYHGHFWRVHGRETNRFLCLLAFGLFVCFFSFLFLFLFFRSLCVGLACTLPFDSLYMWNR